MRKGFVTWLHNQKDLSNFMATILLIRFYWFLLTWLKSFIFFVFYWNVDHALILLILNNGLLCFFERILNNICKAENSLQNLTFQIAKSAFSWSALNALIYSRATIKWKSDNKVKEEKKSRISVSRFFFTMGHKKLQEPKCRNSSLTMASIKSLSHRVGSPVSNYQPVHL